MQAHGFTVLVFVVWYKPIAYVSSHKSFMGCNLSFSTKYAFAISSVGLHTSKMVWLVTFVVCLAPGFTHGPSGCPPQPGHNLAFALYGVESDLRRQSGLELLIPHACMFTIRTFIASSYSNCK